MKRCWNGWNSGSSGIPTKRQRKALVEHPFGTIKRWTEQGYFLMRGMKKVGAETPMRSPRLGWAHVEKGIRQTVR
jgi:hypothetical protein